MAGVGAGEETAATADWRDQMLRAWIAALPAHISPEQAETVQELEAVVSDPEFERQWRAGMGEFWRFVARTGVDAGAWAAAMRRISERAAAASAHGARPEGCGRKRRRSFTVTP